MKLKKKSFQFYKLLQIKQIVIKRIWIRSEEKNKLKGYFKILKSQVQKSRKGGEK
jgi:hypothetical protein